MKKVNEVSRLAGVSKRTLQFYDDEGLLPAQRSKDNYRLYDDAALERLWEILVYRAMGLDLKEIKDLLTLSEKQKNQYLEKKIRGLRQQIRQLNGQMEFISYVQQNGMLPVPTEENTVEKTYMDHIAVLRKIKQYHLLLSSPFLSLPFYRLSSDHLHPLLLNFLHNNRNPW